MTLPEAHWVDPNPESPADAASVPWVRAAVALAATLFATETGPPPDARLRWLGQELTSFVAALDVQARLLLRASLFATTALAPLLCLRFVRFERLTGAERAHALERFERSPFGLSLLAAKAALCILWFEHPDVAREIGFDGRSLRDEADA